MARALALALALAALAGSSALQLALPHRTSLAAAPLPSLASLPALSRRGCAAPRTSVLRLDAAVAEEAEEPKDGMMDTLVTGSFFALWYLFNIGYNIYNKKALNALPIPWTMALLQLFVGIPYCFALWITGLRKAPKLSTDDVKTLIPSSLAHLGTHIGAVISLGAGAVSFTHIVKASEPVVSAALSAMMLGAFYSPVTYLTLLPIVGGVALASLKELSFTWLGFVSL